MRPHIMIRFALGLAAAWTPVVAHAQTAAPSKLQAPWTVPRTPDGRPDLQGNWSNATLTSFERPAGLPLVLTKAQVAQLEKVRSDTIEKLGQRSDPNRTAPPVGGDGSTGAAGNVGGYNYFWIDAGDHIAVVNVVAAPIHEGLEQTVAPGILTRADLPDALRLMAGRPVTLISPVAPNGRPMLLKEARASLRAAAAGVRVVLRGEGWTLERTIR